MTRLLVAVYFIEAGLLLIWAPWTTWWQRNFFAELLPSLRPVMASGAVRGIFVATGVVTAIAGVSELGGAIVARFSSRVPSARGRTPDA